MEDIRFQPIGVIHSPFKDPATCPRQPGAANGAGGTVEVFEPYLDGLADLEGFSHILLVFYLHLSEGYSLKVTPRHSDQLRGVFATRSPYRPNPIGISIVELLRVEGKILHIKKLDMVDGTPLLDIKPYIPSLEPNTPTRTGWFAQRTTA